jgi:hypothetical protein
MQSIVYTICRCFVDFGYLLRLELSAETLGATSENTHRTPAGHGSGAALRTVHRVIHRTVAVGMGGGGKADGKDEEGEEGPSGLEAILESAFENLVSLMMAP